MDAVRDLSLFSIAEETSAWKLLEVLNSTSTLSSRILPGHESSCVGFDRASVGLDCDEVYQNIFISDGYTALNKKYLCDIRVTHVLNAAEGDGETMVDTNGLYYADCGIAYMGLPLHDIPTFKISDYFEVCANFIDLSVRSGGRILVHCLKGRSRSSTVVAAYLMMKVGIPGPMALRMCRLKRLIAPNGGFLVQLAELHNSLQRQSVHR